MKINLWLEGYKMSLFYQIPVYVFMFLLSTTCCSYLDSKSTEFQWKQLIGEHIDDCICSVETVDQFNNLKVYPRVKSLLINDYFKFYKVNLKRDCPFWSDDSRCAIRFCHVETCNDADIPAGLKGSLGQYVHDMKFNVEKYPMQSPKAQSDCNTELSYLNTTISADTYRELALWQEYDDAEDNFCVEQEDAESEYVDLSLNPERYTGYKGESAHKIWRSIYMENCFRPGKEITSYIKSDNINGMCLEKRVFYRVLSGLHTSINIHLCSKYLLSEKQKDLSLISPNGYWGPNVDEFHRRFSPETSNGEGPQWLKNLYFIYLLEMRALVKASGYLEDHKFYTGNDTNDEDVRLALTDLLGVLKSFPKHFNESSMFMAGTKAAHLKEQFRQHFRNISRIMDCVGCDKCKLWGKLQTQGLGTALKILFSGKFDDNFLSSEKYLTVSKKRKNFKLRREEIVALMNSFGRLSTSIFQLERFRKIK